MNFLQPDNWKKANLHVICKAISEFSHERLIEPQWEGEDGDWGRYRLKTDVEGLDYRFRAKRLKLDHWLLDRRSVQKSRGGLLEELDAQALIMELRGTLGLSAAQLPPYVAEISSTLYSAAYKFSRRGLTSRQLTEASFQEVEAAMMEGHPIFVANNGRMGFDAMDFAQYAPEAALPVKIVWLAGHQSQADFRCVEGYSYPSLMETELGADLLGHFQGILRAEDLDPEEYVFIPVHPWQWANRIAQGFAADIAKKELVFLGSGEDNYQAQQSIRTFFNSSHPKKHYVKTALSIVNMGFERGLSPKRMLMNPPINQWVGQLIAGDGYLEKLGFTILREVASMGYRHRYNEEMIEEVFSPYKDMLGSLWRESPINQLKQGQRLMTMASLLHVDRQGQSLLVELIRSSGLVTSEWLEKYLHCYLKPQLHCLYAHHFVFTPHGENVILVLENNVPVRMILKDIGEDVGVVNPKEELPEEVKCLAIPVPEEFMTLTVFTDVFDCFFRFMAANLHEHAGFSEDRFWGLVAACIRDFQQEQPNFREDYRKYDLFAPEFLRNCLNRLQLKDREMMVDVNSDNPAESLQFAGMLQNPVAGL